MKQSKKATSIVEAMVVMMIVVSGVVGMYNVYNESVDLALSTNNKIQAIQIAREGIEAVKNIRDTNMLLYGADPTNCWNAYNYDTTCVGSTAIPDTPDDTDIKAGIYYPVKDNDNRWQLINSIIIGIPDVKLDANGLYTQDGGVEFKPTYTREIEISYPDGDSNTDTMKVISRVKWNGKDKPHQLEFSTTLTNWYK